MLCLEDLLMPEEVFDLRLTALSAASCEVEFLLAGTLHAPEELLVVFGRTPCFAATDDIVSVLGRTALFSSTPVRRFLSGGAGGGVGGGVRERLPRYRRLRSTFLKSRGSDRLNSADRFRAKSGLFLLADA